MFYVIIGEIACLEHEKKKYVRKMDIQVTLAEKLGVSKGTIAMWEVGKRKPDLAEAPPKLGKWSTEDELMDLIKLYLSIDDHGK